MEYLAGDPIHVWDCNYWVYVVYVAGHKQKLKHASEPNMWSVHTSLRSRR